MTSPGELVVTGTAQHAAWRARTMPPVEQVGADVWSIPVPLPQSPLRYVSVYTFAVPGGLVLIDTGWESDESWAALTDGLASIGAGITDVRGVLVTHMHFDHIGLAGRVREESGAWVALHEADHAMIVSPEFRDAQVSVVAEVRYLRSLGAGASEAVDAVGGPERYEPFSRIALPDRHLVDGELADLPGWTLRAIHTPGHTPGHVCFVEERLRTLFSGDHVLPRITPNISTERRGPTDPLGQYLGSLAKVRDLDVEHVFPAYEWRFDGLAARADQITAHHHHRLDELVRAIEENPLSTPWELASHLTWSRPWDQYNGRMQIFAVTETAAHVAYLTAQGTIRSDGGDVARYTAAAHRSTNAR